MSLIEQFMGRKAGPLVQFVKYGIAGGVATGVHIVCFHLVAWKLFPALQESDWAVRLFGLSVLELSDSMRCMNSMYSNGVAFIFSNLVAYIINVLWVFETGRHNRWVEFGLFYLVSGCSVFIGTGIMGLLINFFGIQTTIAFLSNIVAAVMINYALRKFVIFKG